MYRRERKVMMETLILEMPSTGRRTQTSSVSSPARAQAVAPTARGKLNAEDILLKIFTFRGSPRIRNSAVLVMLNTLPKNLFLINLNLNSFQK